MAVMNRYSLVLNGVNVVRDVVAGTMGLGGNLAYNQMPAMPISTRRLSQPVPATEQEPGPRYDHAPSGVDNHAVDRAGRPGCPSACARTRSVEAWRLSRFTDTTRRFTGEVLAERRLTAPVLALRSSRRLGRLSTPQARKQAAAAKAGIKPAGVALPATTRG
jgi:hypothetical protein